MQAQYAISVEHERVANETLLETNAKWKLAEAQLSTFKQDKIRLTSELDILKMKLTNLEDSKQRLEKENNYIYESVQIEITWNAGSRKQFKLVSGSKCD